MKTHYLATLALLLSVESQAEEVLRTVSFSSDADTLVAGEILEDDTLRVTADPEQPFQVLIELSDPGITSPVYALKGMIRYTGIEGEGYLQLSNDFGEQGVFYTKTVAEEGPLQTLSGKSAWRTFILPFQVSPGDKAEEAVLTPRKLSLGLYLPGSGSVTIRDLSLHQYSRGEDPLHADGLWFSGRTAGIFGGIAGTLIGIWGAIIGMLASRGKARGVVVGSANALIVVGIVILLLGLVALIAGQPYAVYYSLLLIGVLLLVVVGGIRRVLPRRYEAIELKKMQAMDT